MCHKPHYDELVQRIQELEIQAEKSRQMERELLKRQKYLESVLHHAPDAIITLGKNFLGEICWSAFRNASGPCLHCTNTQLLNDQGESTGVYTWEDFNPINAKWYLNYDRAVPWIDGRYVRIQIAVDMTERKQAEEALRNSEQTYRNLYNNAQVGLGRTRISDGKVLESNAKMAQIFGYDRVDAFIENFVLSENYVDPDCRKRILQEIQQKGLLNNKEVEFYRKDGSRAWVRFDTQIFPDKGYMEDVIIDITQEKRAQEESLKLEGQLIQAQKYEALGTLTGGIAHDFNNILGVILGYTEIAQIQVPASDPSQKALEQVKKASLRARDIVSQLLTFSRKREEQLEVIDIRMIVKECLKMLRSSIPTSVEFQSHLAEELNQVRVDGTQIHQIMVNLCTNASHAMEQGGLFANGFFLSMMKRQTST